ncbi:MAG: hypothetical protein IT363_06575 [Methanoregulaceae archaeon]|nr:hypothetical protein [Methanoregulaceae archaeon]
MTSAELLDKIRGVRVLVIGDVMLDEYIFGRATRISPEAPVMVLRQERTSAVPGGAANVARNVAAFGASAHLVGLVGDDATSDRLEQGLAAESLTCSLIRDAGRVTSRKTRIIADGRHQVVRIDHEDDVPAAGPIHDQLIEAARPEIDKCDVVLLSDYTKGCLSAEVVRSLLQAAKAAWKPVVVNAKPSSLDSYRGATVISLNRSEASAAAGVEITSETAEEHARRLRERHRADALVITLGDAGMEVAGPSSFRIAAPRVEVADPAGAGDTVIATIAMGIGAIGFGPEIFELAAAAAARVVQHVGVVAPSEIDLASLRHQVS